MAEISAEHWVLSRSMCTIDTLCLHDTICISWLLYTWDLWLNYPTTLLSLWKHRNAHVKIMKFHHPLWHDNITLYCLHLAQTKQTISTSIVAKMAQNQLTPKLRWALSQQFWVKSFVVTKSQAPTIQYHLDQYLWQNSITTLVSDIMGY